MEFVAELLVAFLIIVGGFFALVGSYGLVKLPDTMRRLHAPTKATTLGVGGILLASMAYFFLLEGNFSIHELLITLFLFIAAPLTANMISKAYMHVSLKAEELPAPAQKRKDGSIGWATYDPKAERDEIR